MDLRNEMNDAVGSASYGASYVAVNHVVWGAGVNM